MSNTPLVDRAQLIVGFAAQLSEERTHGGEVMTSLIHAVAYMAVGYRDPKVLTARAALQMAIDALSGIRDGLPDEVAGAAS